MLGKSNWRKWVSSFLWKILLSHPPNPYLRQKWSMVSSNFRSAADWQPFLLPVPAFLRRLLICPYRSKSKKKKSRDNATQAKLGQPDCEWILVNGVFCSDRRGIHEDDYRPTCRLSRRSTNGSSRETVTCSCFRQCVLEDLPSILRDSILATHSYNFFLFLNTIYSNHFSFIVNRNILFTVCDIIKTSFCRLTNVYHDIAIFIRRR